ncbi:MAG: heavy-metal-associated domain-containing protein [Ignavibacteriae bacterium]|nr:heavy-metal-associated domain-containing protein [Ignavibacteriota bacterium]
MKYFLLAIACICLISSSTSFSQTISNSKTETFKVWGNCGMCKKTIEKAVNKEGIVSAEWNKTTKIITVMYDSTQTSLDQIQTKIADAGYDNVGHIAHDDDYSKLNKCCRYERKK